MTSTQILQVLNLTKNKQTTNFCSKLASLFIFIKLIIQDAFLAEISGNDFTIDDNGKLMELKQIDAKYKNNRLNHYRYNDAEIQALTKKECELRCELNKVCDLLWKKRKNKDNSVLESERDNLRAELNAIDKSKDALIEVEKIRLQSIVTDIKVMRKELNLLTGCKMLIETDKGSYSFYLPIDNSFYYEVCRMLNLPFEVAKVEAKKVLHKFITYPYLIDNIKRAIPFTSNDNLRPAMTCICLDFSKAGLQVVSTDAHRMYYSTPISIEGYTEPMQILIAPESIKALSKLKLKDSEPLTITIFEDNTASFNGFEVNVLPDTRYPDYKVVIPEYKLSMEFDKAELISNVKKVMPYSNKVTSQVTFHLNGSIALNACDVDFEFECDADMPYITKQFPDTDIAFNGKFLIESLGIFKEKTIKMLTDGSSTKAGIFTNDIDTVLLMPLMLNN